jgi:hypothetical protein
MALYASIWLYMAPIGSIWFHMAPYGSYASIWLQMDADGPFGSKLLKIALQLLLLVFPLVTAKTLSCLPTY